MTTQVLKNAHFDTIGYIETDADGTQTGKDAHDNTVGYYRPGSDQTTDRLSNVVGYGNFLAALVVAGRF